jgi:hypothetical protein
MKIGETKTIMSRYGQPRVFTKVARNKYIVDGPSAYCRGGATNDGNPFIDYDGGPFLCTGDSMSFYIGESAKKEIIEKIIAIESSQDDYLTLEITTRQLSKVLKL